MALTLLLDEYTLPNSGVVDLHLNRSFEIKVTAEQAQRQVKHWLFNEVSMMLTSQTPTLVMRKIINRLTPWVNLLAIR